jgi:hypothetical protein
MNQDKKDLTLDESVAQVMQTLPPVIRQYLVQEKYTAVTKGLMAKYALRVDQAGILEREIMLLLMGIDSPDEFIQALVEEAQLSQSTINSIVQEVNDQIFIPLRKKEEAEGMNAEKPVEAGEAKKTAASGTTPREVATAPHIAPLPPKVAMPQVVRTQGSLAEVVQAALAAPAPLAASTLLEDHEEPVISFNKILAPQPSARILPPPVNLPGVLPDVPKPASPFKPIVPKPVPAPITSYSADPYREPIDEPVDEMESA